MPALKLFISHSSVFEEPSQADAHLNLVQETCQAIRQAYPNQIEILVDYDGLPPACEWRKRLHSWLYECDAAIILFSRRARDQSDWVKFEASVLSHRASREPGFKLIPVLLRDETEPNDLEQGFWRAISLAERQCIRSAQCAQEIVAGLNTPLGELLATQNHCSFGRRFSVIRSLIADYCAKDEDKGLALREAWEAVAGPNDVLPDWPIEPIGRYSLALTIYIFHDANIESNTKPGLGAPCFEDAVGRFRKVFRKMSHPFQSPKHIRDYILPLWVHEQAACDLLEEQKSEHLVALNGNCILLDDPKFNIKSFTLHRYYQRTNLTIDETMDCIPISVWNTHEVTTLIRNTVNRGDEWEEFDEDERKDLDQDIKGRDIPLFLVVDAKDSGLPNNEEVEAILQFRRSFCPALQVVFATGAMIPATPEKVVFLNPPLDTRAEKKHLRCERDLKTAIPG